MEKFVTPIKENCAPAYKSTSQRQGDWICFNCNNLNFSFRKKCNRCKTQTREQNEMTQLYPYYYYVQPEREAPRERLSDQRIPLASHNNNLCGTASTPPKEQSTTNSNKRGELPSVSPLLKKYRASQKSDKLTLLNSEVMDLLSQNKNGKNIFGISNQDDSFWKNIGIDADVKDFRTAERSIFNYNQEHDSSETDDCDEELEKLIGNIIL